MKHSYSLIVAAVLGLPAWSGAAPAADRESAPAQIVQRERHVVLAGAAAGRGRALIVAGAPQETTLKLAQVDAPGEPPPPPDPAAIAHWANDMARATTRTALGGVFPGQSARRPIVVGADPKNLPTIEEDLNVMMRILEKTAGAKEDGAKAMGIDVFSFVGGSFPRMFYLADYGALFVLKVKYPLLPPARPDEENGTNEQTNSEWERARQEVYGGRGALDELKLAWRDGGPAEEFDADRVDKLKAGLLDDLANATHIRALKADDYVTVVVTGTGARSTSKATVHRESGPRGMSTREVHRTIEGGAQTTLTLRAKKSDIDALAKGKLKSEEFRKKASVQLY